MTLVYYFLVIAILLLLSHKVCDYLLYARNKRRLKEIENNAYAHNIVMEIGEILSRAPTDRYPDMEINQARAKLYYQRMKETPISIGNAVSDIRESTKPILISVK